MTLQFINLLNKFLIYTIKFQSLNFRAGPKEGNPALFPFGL